MYYSINIDLIKLALKDLRLLDKLNIFTTIKVYNVN
jgi:hypothetical protein